MCRNFHLWIRLAPCERHTVTILVLLLPATSLALGVLGFKRTRDLLARYSHAECSDISGTTDQAHRLARLVSIAAHHGPYHATCLRQSLVLWWLLRRRGIAAELRIGVRKQGDELQAHAWVEHLNRPLNDGQGATSSYATLTAPTQAVVEQ